MISLSNLQDRPNKCVLRLRKTWVKSPEPTATIQKGLRLQQDYLRNLIRPLLGEEFVPDVEIVSVGAEMEEILRSLGKLRPVRRRHRCLPMDNRLGELVRDCAWLSTVSSGVQFCVEIKPKQGFRFLEADGLEMCRTCLRQYSKVRKDFVTLKF